MSHAHSAIDSLIANLTLQRYQKGGQVTKQPINEIVSEIYSEMPMLKQHDFVVKGVDKFSEYYDPKFPKRSSIEFMSSGEPANPYEKPYVELYEDAPTDRKELKRAIWGDMLHHLSDVDPYWRSLRDEYIKDRPNRVKLMDRRAYESSDDKRSFEKWMNLSRSDAHIRAGLQGYSNWKNVPRTKRQEEILKTMNRYLRTGNRDMSSR